MRSALVRPFSHPIAEYQQADMAAAEVHGTFIGKVHIFLAQHCRRDTAGEDPAITVFHESCVTPDLQAKDENEGKF